MSNSFVAAYYDAEAVTPEDWSVAALAFGEATRLAKLMQVAQVAAGMKRRLGGDAEQSELARDKKRSRQVGHLASQMMGGWLTDALPLATVRFETPGRTPEWAEIARLAATVEWERYANETTDELRDRCRLVVTWALNNNERKFANRAANRYNVEMERMTRVMAQK